MSIQWYISHAGKTLGPLSSAQLKQLATQGKINAETQVRQGADGAWVAAGRVQRLFEGAAAAHGTQAPASTMPVPPLAPPPLASNMASPPPAPPTAPPVASGAHQPAAEPARSKVPVWLGLAGIILAVIALTTFWMPVVGLPMAVLGLVLGLAGVAVALTRSASGLWPSIVATSISVVSVLAATGWWYVASRLSTTTDTVRELRAQLEVPQQLPPRPQPTPAPAPPPAPPAEIIWTDASQPAMLGDARVRVVSAAVAQVRVDDLLDLAVQGRSRRKTETVLQIGLSFENTSPSRTIEYRGFLAMPEGVGGLLGSESQQLLAIAVPKLVDNSNTPYSQKSSPLGTDVLSSLNTRPIEPGKLLEDKLTFAPPSPMVEYLRLELPGGCIGIQGVARFQIPVTMISGLAK